MTTCLCGNDITGFCPGVEQCPPAQKSIRDDKIAHMPQKIDHNYLPMQFANCEDILSEIRKVVRRGDFTLGEEVALFEKEFAAMVGVKHAIGVGNGTDALFLALKAMGVKHNNGTVITTPYSFYATTSSIHNAGAHYEYVDVGEDFNIDVDKIREAITPHTVGIIPVHWAGRPCNMAAVMGIAEQHGLWVIEDCAHAPNSVYHGRKCGSFGEVNAFSLHPLKNVNVWGDGGVITTNSDEKAEWLRKARNHGMTDRNTCEFWGWNSRLDTVQAVVGRYVLGKIEKITAQRRANAMTLNRLLQDVVEISLPPEAPDTAPNFYLYSFHAKRRDELQKYLVMNGVDAKVHYPKPLHKQPANKKVMGRSMPVAEWCANSTLSLPVHEWITEEQLNRMATLIKQFYASVRVKSLWIDPNRGGELY